MSKPKIRVAERLMAKKLDGEWVLLNVATGVYYELNEVGSTIWDELKTGKDPESILDCLEEEFQADRGELRRDLTGFLENLRSEKLIDEVGSSM